MPSLSIIIPVYNKAPYLAACLDSILVQSYSDFELILVNDGSTDGSGTMCDQYATRDVRVRVLHQKNAGVSAARNAGMKLASGKYFGFADSDDFLEPDMYEVIIASLEKTDSQMAMCGVKKVYADGERLFFGTGETKIYTRDQALSALLKDEFLGSVYDKVYRANIIDDLQFTGRMYEDFYFNFLVLKRISRCVFVDRIKYHWIIRENSVSMTQFNSKYMEVVDFSKRILETTSNELADHIDEARAFDFHMNMWVLNLIIFSSKEKHKEDYEKLLARIRDYKSFVSSPLIKKKYRYAFYLLNMSPKLYETALKMQAKMAKTEITKRG